MPEHPTKKKKRVLFIQFFNKQKTWFFFFFCDGIWENCFIPDKGCDVLHGILDIWPGDGHSPPDHPYMAPYKNCADMVAILDFCNDPNRSHMSAIVQIAPYFLEKKNGKSRKCVSL